MDHEQARPESWDTTPMPDRKAPIALHRTFTPQEYERLKRGLVPQAMENKWFIYWQTDWLSFHRSWTGVCQYQVRLQRDGARYRVAEAWANRDPEQSLVTDKSEDADRDFEWALLLFLIDRLLLARDVPFPAPSADENDNAALIKHMFVGYARANDED